MTDQTQVIIEDDSPSVALIKLWYEQYKLSDWDNARVGRVCRTLRVTVEELCALCGVFGRNRVRALWRHGEKGRKWPPEIALNMANLERAALEVVFRTASQPSPQECCTAVLMARLKDL